MNREWAMVKDFHEKFGHPAADNPAYLREQRAKARYGWMREELDEFLEAEDITDQADAMIDLIYFALGTLVEMGVKPDEIFNIVHDANMTKLWEDGKPRYDKDGKTKKPAGWKDPYPRLREAIAAACFPPPA